MSINPGLMRHVTDRFGKLNPVETILVEGLAEGPPIVLASEKGNPRKLRPELIRDILLNPNTYDLPNTGLVIDGGLFEAALDLDGATINHRAGFLRCQFKKGVGLRRAHTRDLNFTGSTLNDGLRAEGAHIRGGLVLRDGFVALGEVNLKGAKIGGQLSCQNATFHNPEGTGLNAEGLKVAGTMLWAGVGGTCRSINLREAHVNVLADCRASWTIAKFLNLDGFTYETIADPAAQDTAARLEWLGRQEKPETPQPYEHLSKVLDRAGQSKAARQILIAKQNAVLKGLKAK